MTEEEVNKYLNQVAFSSAEEFLQKYKDDASIIGHFGLGFYSAFMVADKVDVITKSYKEDTTAVKWTCNGNPEYEIEPHDKSDRGTEIILHISEENEDFLKEWKIRELLNKYCKFLPFEIKFGTRTETSFEGEGEDQKEIKTEVDDIVNNPNPLWRKKPSELTDEDYKSFYNELYPMSPAPLFWIHLNIDYPFNLTGILYFPKINNSVEIQKNKIQLYSNQVFVTDDVKEIVPEFLMLLHGVIDSPDIPLNVSRSYLQSDSNVKKINTYITKKVGEKLASLFKEDRKAYEEKWTEINTFVKYGMVSDEKFYDKALGFGLVKDIDNVYYTFEEYKEKIKINQTDKNGKLVTVYTNDPIGHNSYVKSATNYGYNVVVLDNIIDNHFMQHLEYKDGQVTFVRVDSDTVDKLIQKDETKESVVSQSDQDKVKEIFSTLVQNDKGARVELAALMPEDQPVIVTKPEFMRRMKEMQMLQGMDMQMFPESYQIVVNSNHPLITEKLLKQTEQDEQKELAGYLYKLGLLHQNMLKGEALSEFVQQSIAHISK